MNDNAITIYETSDKKARFYFSYSDNNLTTGVLVLQPGGALPKHNRPHAIENLTQVYGKCLMTLFDEKDGLKEIKLTVGEGIKMPKAQWHIHANPYNEVSITLFIAEGNILDIMDELKKVNTKVETNKPKNL
jgi:quercetin dioxygenase-like cupin family protein